MLKNYDLNVDRLNRGLIFIEQKEKELEQLEAPVELKDCIQIAMSRLTGMPRVENKEFNSRVESSVFQVDKTITKEDIRRMISKEKSKLYPIKREIEIIGSLLKLVESKQVEDAKPWKQANSKPLKSK
jgi:pyruvate formate-lyase activating enzyme-like uncharacterized protein